MSMRLALLIAATLPVTACVIDHNHDTGGGFGGGGGEVCDTADSLVVDTGADVTHEAGVDAGYYATYTGNGHWHIEWTCDTAVSAQGCNFTGTITFDTAAGAAAPTCFDCESDDIMNVSTQGTQTQISFDTITATGIDGVDFVSIPGNPVTVDLELDGLVQNDLVFVPSRGQTQSPVCMPLVLTPSNP
jgi:hypothetical protein